MLWLVSCTVPGWDGRVAAWGSINDLPFVVTPVESAMNQAERKFALSIVGQGGHGPFRELDAPFTLGKA
jgi:hypothetical protein